MPTYSNLGTTLITTGDEAGTWGDTTNTNLSNLGTAICGYLSVVCVAGNTVSANPLDLNVPNGTAGDGLNKILFFTSSGSVDLGANSYVRITKNSSSTAPYFEGWYFVRNSLSGNRSLIIFQGTFSSLSASDYVTIPNGKDAIIYCGPDTASPKVNLLYTNPSFATLVTTGNAGIGGTLGVSGATTLSSTLETTGSVGIGGNPSGSYKVYTAAGSLGGFYTTSSALTLQYSISTDTSSSGMNIYYYKDSSSPLDGDDIVNLRCLGNDSGGNSFEYARIVAGIEDTANGNEDGALTFYTAKAGVLSAKIYLDSTYGVRMPDVYANSISGRDVFITTTGELGYFSSSIKTKLDVVDSPYGLDYVLQLRPVLYRHYKEPEGAVKKGGFIAEEVDALGLKEFVQYGEDNEPSGLDYGLMTSLLTKAIQEQQAMIEDLKARVAALGG
jgi:hypothetical protein